MGDTRPWQTLAARTSMPWLETAPMNEREHFIADCRLNLYTMTELCARYNVARKTGYKWLARMAEGGRAALRDRSRAPHHCPHRITAEVAERICGTRQAHPSWGPRMLLQWLARRAPEPRPHPARRGATDRETGARPTVPCHPPTARDAAVGGHAPPRGTFPARDRAASGDE